MKYTGIFKSIIRDKEYHVEIVTGNNSTPAAGELTLGPDPFVTKMEAGTTIYSPVKYQSAEIQIVNDEYMFSLYSSTAKQNTVKLLDASNNLIFNGYTTPNIYDAAYDFVVETYNVEAIDGLAILRYYDYETIGSVKDFRTFAELINHLLSTSGCYTKWYWSKTTGIVDASGNVPEQMTISEACFFDEDDEPMKMNEVLEEICRFCGVTAIAVGDSVYFIDYDGIKNNKNAYLQYTVGTNTTSTTVQLVDNHTITKDDYSSTGSNISLQGTYSKVTVKDSLYAVDSIMPEMFNDEDLVNDHYVSDSSQNWTYTYPSMVYRIALKDNKKDWKWFNVKYRSYKDNKFNHHYYNDTTGSEILTEVEYSATSSQHIIGAGFMKFNVGVGETREEAYDNLKYDSWDNYLQVSTDFKSGEHLVLQTKPEFSKPFFMSSNTKIIFEGSLMMGDMTWYRNENKAHVATGWFPSEDLESENIEYYQGSLKTYGFEVHPNDITMKFGLSLGNYSATGENSWTSGTSGTIDIPFCERELRYDTQNKNKLKEKWYALADEDHDVLYKSFPICNNVQYSDKVDSDGFIISCSGIGNDVVIAAKPIVSVYTSDLKERLYDMLPNEHLINHSQWIGVYWIKDFNVKAVVPYEGGKDNTQMDVEYSYVINDDYTNKLSDITFKICTYDGKQLNYSAVAYPYNGNYKFVDQLYNAGLNMTNRAENICCYRIVNQYKDPVKKITLNLFNDYTPWTLLEDTVLNIQCIIDSMSIDYVYDRAQLELVQKI